MWALEAPRGVSKAAVGKGGWQATVRARGQGWSFAATLPGMLSSPYTLQLNLALQGILPMYIFQGRNIENVNIFK